MGQGTRRGAGEHGDDDTADWRETADVFRVAAEAYCAVIRSATSMPRDEFVESVYRTLADTVALGARLPDVGFDDAPDYETRIDFAAWKERYDEIQLTLGPWSSYWTAMSPYGDDPEEYVEQRTALLPLADDLADVWRDLQDGLDALEAGAPLDVVLFEWRLLFRAHWGRHATEALRALQVPLSSPRRP